MVGIPARLHRNTMVNQEAGADGKTEIGSANAKKEVVPGDVVNEIKNLQEVQTSKLITHILKKFEKKINRKELKEICGQIDERFRSGKTKVLHHPKPNTNVRKGVADDYNSACANTPMVRLTASSSLHRRPRLSSSRRVAAQDSSSSDQQTTAKHNFKVSSSDHQSSTKHSFKVSSSADLLQTTKQSFKISSADLASRKQSFKVSSVSSSDPQLINKQSFKVSNSNKTGVDDMTGSVGSPMHKVKSTKIRKTLSESNATYREPMTNSKDAEVCKENFVRNRIFQWNKLQEKAYCRLCGKEKESRFCEPLFSEKAKENDLVTKVVRTCGVDIKENDPLPKVICRICEKFVSKMSDFRKMCQRTQLKFSFKRSVMNAPRLALPAPPSNKEPPTKEPTTKKTVDCKDVNVKNKRTKQRILIASQIPDAININLISMLTVDQSNPEEESESTEKIDEEPESVHSLYHDAYVTQPITSEEREKLTAAVNTDQPSEIASIIINECPSITHSIKKRILNAMNNSCTSFGQTDSSVLHHQFRNENNNFNAEKIYTEIRSIIPFFIDILNSVAGNEIDFDQTGNDLRMKYALIYAILMEVRWHNLSLISRLIANIIKSGNDMQLQYMLQGKEEYIPAVVKKDLIRPLIGGHFMDGKYAQGVRGIGNNYVLETLKGQLKQDNQCDDYHLFSSDQYENYVSFLRISRFNPKADIRLLPTTEFLHSEKSEDFEASAKEMATQIYPEIFPTPNVIKNIIQEHAPHQYGNEVPAYPSGMSMEIVPFVNMRSLDMVDNLNCEVPESSRARESMSPQTSSRIPEPEENTESISMFSDVEEIIGESLSTSKPEGNKYKFVDMATALEENEKGASIIFEPYDFTEDILILTDSTHGTERVSISTEPEKIVGKSSISSKLKEDTIETIDNTKFVEKQHVSSVPESTSENGSVPLKPRATVENGSVPSEPETTVDYSSVRSEPEETVENGSVRSEPEATVENGSVRSEPEATVENGSVPPETGSTVVSIELERMEAVKFDDSISETREEVGETMKNEFLVLEARDDVSMATTEIEEAMERDSITSETGEAMEKDSITSDTGEENLSTLSEPEESEETGFLSSQSEQSAEGISPPSKVNDAEEASLPNQDDAKETNIPLPLKPVHDNEVFLNSTESAQNSENASEKLASTAITPVYSKTTNDCTAVRKHGSDEELLQDSPWSTLRTITGFTKSSLLEHSYDLMNNGNKTITSKIKPCPKVKYSDGDKHAFSFRMTVDSDVCGTYSKTYKLKNCVEEETPTQRVMSRAKETESNNIITSNKSSNTDSTTDDVKIVFVNTEVMITTLEDDGRGGKEWIVNRKKTSNSKNYDSSGYRGRKPYHTKVYDASDYLANKSYYESPNQYEPLYLEESEKDSTHEENNCKKGQKKKPLRIENTKQKSRSKKKRSKDKKRFVYIIGDGMLRTLRGIDLKRKLNTIDSIFVRCFPGATTNEMVTYSRTTMEKNPSCVILHCGTNDLPNGTTANEIAINIVELASLLKNQCRDIMISGIIPRRDRWDVKRQMVNMEVRNKCSILNIAYRDHHNIDKEKDLDKGGVNLTKRGSSVLFQNYVETLESFKWSANQERKNTP